MHNDYVLAALRHRVPENAVAYCFDLWERNNFVLKIKRPRRSKLGDYRFSPKTGVHHISLNKDLNTYSFLITYLHEVAHLLTFRAHGRKVAPHGEAWKRNFRDITQPILSPSIFPEKVLKVLVDYMSNPMASSCSDPSLMRALSEFDENHNLFLHELAHGSVFKLHQRQFRKGELRRTRYVCQEVKSGRSYLISGMAPVEGL